MIVTAQTTSLARGADDPDIDGHRPARTSHAELIAEQVRETVVRGSRRAQDSILALVHYGQDGFVMTARVWTASVGRLAPFVGRDAPLLPVPAGAVRGGYDLFEQLLAGHRRFVDGLVAEQRRFAEQLLTPPDHR